MSIKICPICGSKTFEDMEVCYSCMYVYESAVKPSLEIEGNNAPKEQENEASKLQEEDKVLDAQEDKAAENQENKEPKPQDSNVAKPQENKLAKPQKSDELKITPKIVDTDLDARNCSILVNLNICNGAVTEISASLAKDCAMPFQKLPQHDKSDIAYRHSSNGVLSAFGHC